MLLYVAMLRNAGNHATTKPAIDQIIIFWAPVGSYVTSWAWTVPANSNRQHTAVEWGDSSLADGICCKQGQGRDRRPGRVALQHRTQRSADPPRIGPPLVHNPLKIGSNGFSSALYILFMLKSVLRQRQIRNPSRTWCMPEGLWSKRRQTKTST